MKKHVIKIIDNNWFFVSLVLFAIVLPLSQAFVSIGAGIMLFIALSEDRWKNKLNRLKQNRILFALPAIYLIYLLSAVVSNKITASLYDLQKSLFFLVIPVAFLLGKPISSNQKRFVFYSFLVSIVISTVIAIVNWKISANSEAFSVHHASLISHIRFSFQLILAFWFSVLLIFMNFKKLRRFHFLLLAAGAVYFIAFLFFQQSLTGLIAFLGSFAFFLLFSLFKTGSRFQIYLVVFVLVLMVFPVGYIIHAVQKFYDFEVVDKNSIDKQTEKGNLYRHDFNNPLVENGKYVYLYVCEEEAREEWNKLSEFQYDSIGVNGYPVYSTLLRYLTSKGLRKDAEGVKSLTSEDIQNVENGIANVIYAENRFSLYPRIYQTVWEYYTYSKTGNANQKSFSQRIEYARAALSIIKENPWFGVGTGNWKQEFKNTYQKNTPNLKEEFYASAHNQYLNYMVKFGVVGFIAIFALLLYPVLKTRQYKDILFLLFLVFMFFANWGDSNFESHMGSSFFVFFYCLFILNKPNYLKIS
jgi:hypothetical protein